MKLSIVHTTRGRVDWPINMIQMRFKLCSKHHEIEYILALDDDDPVAHDTLSCHPVVQEVGIKVVWNRLSDGPRFCHVLGMNTGYRHSTGDIILVGDDDVHYPDLWDERVISFLDEATGGDIQKPMVLGIGDPHFDGGSYGGDGLLGTFIATRAWYEKQGGFMAYPEYDGMVCDFEFTQKAAMDDCLFDAYDRLYFRHHWHGCPGDPQRDDTHKRHQDGSCHHIGYAVYAERTHAGLPDVVVHDKDAPPLGFSSYADRDRCLGRIGNKDVVSKEWVDWHVQHRENRGFGHIENKAFSESDPRHFWLKGDWKTARDGFEPIIKKYHKRICGGRFRFHVGLQYWNDCTRMIGDKKEIGIDEPLTF
jgi:hypothetical protein